MNEALVNAIADMKEQEAIALSEEMLAAGVDPIQLLEQCREGMDVVGKRFSDGRYFLPELMMAGEILARISDMARSKMAASGGPSRARSGTVVLGTVKGDIHDIGKNIVSFLMDLHGFEVVDLGVDVPPSAFVGAVRERQPEILGLCGLLTLAYDPMKETVAALDAAGLRGGVKIMIGGGAIDDEIRKYSGADAYGKDAVAAVTLAKQWTGGE